jgi:glutamate/tyrosine decarboxylase-like PLP-dependent enzyme
MPHKTDDTIDPYTTTIQWSRRFTGLKLFMTLAEAGGEKLAQQIEHQTDMGDLLRRKLIENGWEILNDTPLPVVCFTHSGLDAQQQSAVLDQLYSRGYVWISGTLLRKHTPALRACITSYHTNADDVTFLINELNAALEQTL